MCSSNSGRATRAHRGRGTVTQLPPLVLQSHPLSAAFLRPACRRLLAFLSRLAPPPHAEWFDLLRLQWHTRGRLDLAYRVWPLGFAEARDLMPDRVTFLVTLTIKCLPARRLFSCTHPSLG